MTPTIKGGKSDFTELCNKINIFPCMKNLNKTTLTSTIYLTMLCEENAFDKVLDDAFAFALNAASFPSRRILYHPGLYCRDLRALALYIPPFAADTHLQISAHSMSCLKEKYFLFSSLQKRYVFLKLVVITEQHKFAHVEIYLFLQNTHTYQCLEGLVYSLLLTLLPLIRVDLETCVDYDPSWRQPTGPSDEEWEFCSW